MIDTLNKAEVKPQRNESKIEAIIYNGIITTLVSNRRRCDRNNEEYKGVG